MKLNKRSIYFLMLVASIIAGIWLLRIHEGVINGDKERQSLLAKRIFLDNTDDILINFSPLRKELNDYFSNITSRYSFYFEYLFTGTSIRIGENSSLVAASLMKLPLAMDLYKAAELGQVNLDLEVTIKPEWLDSDFGDLWKRGAGAKITLREAAKLLISESDNTATNVIFYSIDGKLGEDGGSLKELDISIEETRDKRALITARSYGSIIKCLYFACFVSRDNSQEILSYLTQSKFSDRLATGLPSEIKVAHKIGTFSDIVESDCGIVYVPKRTYIICAMFETNHEEAAKYIKEISAKVYNYITNLKKESP